MKKFLALLIIICTQAFAGLPPTTSKGVGDSTDITTFKYQFPNFAITHTGVTASLGVLGVAGGGTGFPSYTVGDFLYADTTTTLAKLPATASGYVLTSNGAGTAPTYQPSGTSVNFILNPGAEVDTSGWATYADAAGVLPVDGTGGSPSVTWTRTTSTPLTSTGSFLFTKGASNRQGDGASYAFTIDSASQAKVLNIEFDYAVASGTFVAGSSGVDSDIEIYIYDVTNATLIQPSTYKLYASATSPPSHFISSFQTASNSTSYRLIFHTATTSASAFTVKFDTVSVAPSKYVYGSPITDWVAYTPTFTGFGTVSLVSFMSRRVGSDLEVRGQFASGTTTATANTITIGYSGANANVTIDNSKLPAQTIIGDASNDNHVSPAVYRLAVIGISAGTTAVQLGIQNSSNDLFDGGLGGSTVVANGSYVNVNFSVPITGWGSSVQMSDNADTRVVTWSGTSTTTINNTTPTLVFTTSYDTHGAFATSTYTVPVPGYYQFVGQVRTGNVAWTNGQALEVYYSKNGGANVTIGRVVSGAYTNQLEATAGASPILCKAGDTIVFKVYSDASNTPSIDMSLVRVSGPVSIAMSESVNMLYTNTAGTSIANSGDVNVPFATKSYDSHSAFSGTVYTVPISGKYMVSGTINFTGALYAATNSLIATIYKNGSVALYGPIVVIAAAITTGVGAPVSGTVPCNAGDTLEIRVSNSRAAGATTLNTSAGTNHIEIERVGN